MVVPGRFVPSRVLNIDFSQNPSIRALYSIGLLEFPCECGQILSAFSAYLPKVVKDIAMAFLCKHRGYFPKTFATIVESTHKFFTAWIVVIVKSQRRPNS